MVAIDTLEGVIDGFLWFHYDLDNDVLYLRLASEHDAETFGEETDDGLILLREATSNVVIGLTIVHWWKRFGQGRLPDSLAEIEARIEPWAKRLAA